MTAHRLAYRVLGSEVEIVAPPEASELLRPLLADFAVGSGPAAVLSLTDGPGGWALRRGVHTLVEDVPLEGAVLRLLQHLNLTVLEEAPVPTVHAGVVRLPGGRVLALPAVSGTGKSTMTAALLAAGAEYVSDEALVLAPGGVVTAYPRPLALSTGRADALGLPPATLMAEGEAVYAPGVLGPVATGELVLTDVVRLHRRLGPAVLTPLPRVEIAPLLLANSFNHFRDPARAFAVAAEAARSCSGWELGYAEAPDGAAAVREQLSR